MSATNASGAQPPKSVARGSKSSLDAIFAAKAEAAMSIDTRIKATAEKLTPLYKRLNSQWEAIEQRLRSELPAREAWYSYRVYNEDPEGRSQWEIHQCIGLVKYRGEWRICHGTYRAPEECSPEYGKPIVDCAVAERIEAVAHVGKLREEILKEAEKSIPQVAEAVDRLSEALKNW